MQNYFSKLTLSTLTNKFLNTSYILLVIFIFISFKYFLFFYKDCIFPKYPIFQFFGKKRDMKREIVRENFGKRKMWQEKILGKEKISEK
jgi:hypothetical protein